MQYIVFDLDNLACGFGTDSSILRELICIIYSNLAQTFTSISVYSIISCRIKHVKSCHITASIHQKKWNKVDKRHSDIYIYIYIYDAFNPLVLGRFHWNLNCLSKRVIFKRNLGIDDWGISCERALMWLSLDVIDNKSTWVLVMAWGCQTISHYQIQCWPGSSTPQGITRPQWVKWYTLVLSIWCVLLPVIITWDYYTYMVVPSLPNNAMYSFWSW